jgi:hypothetical protein
MQLESSFLFFSSPPPCLYSEYSPCLSAMIVKSVRAVGWGDAASTASNDLGITARKLGEEGSRCELDIHPAHCVVFRGSGRAGGGGCSSRTGVCLGPSLDREIE